ncbi:carbohydrate ABC transporter permease [Phytomonospora endophytica]|uniref:Multiple sugar transport system permease protein n=1 Tax=Phytomonospora endophytica TaxID=714109 RepID=A0A841G141_9ACTN|nr:sugar ABC transporter permease [Phytomonospora endophytica]MBB6037880.1 multiple sugar transport system permease protein [Phytomonospora endophytica]GIG68779.1 sugar ABC transporter permease [Phytomonospora endophytica]
MSATPEAAPAARARRRARPRVNLTRWAKGGGLHAVLFAVPVVVVYLYFSWGPVVQGLVFSFQKTNLIRPAEWVGWSNFEYVLGDPGLVQASLNTAYFALLALVFGFPIPIILAVLVTELRKYDTLYNALAYLPAVIPPVAAILLWKFFYDPDSTGLFNSVLGWFGLGPYPWLNDSSSAMPSIVLYATWAGAGSTAIIYIAALATVRTELYEAAEIDGAGIWRRIWHITLPQLRGVIFVMMLLQLIGTFQIFSEPFLFTGGGPNNATQTILLKIYNYAFVNGDFGAATALSVLLALALGLLSAVYYFVTRKWSAA